MGLFRKKDEWPDDGYRKPWTDAQKITVLVISVVMCVVAAVWVCKWYGDSLVIDDYPGVEISEYYYHE